VLLALCSLENTASGIQIEAIESIPACDFEAPGSSSRVTYLSGDRHFVISMATSPKKRSPDFDRSINMRGSEGVSADSSMLPHAYHCEQDIGVSA
jgi:hypothetical protein